MDIFDTLEEENAAIRSLLGKLVDSASGQPEDRRELFLEVSARLHAEIRAERAHLYPLLSEFSQTRQSTSRCSDDSRGTEDLLMEMAGSDPSDPRFRSLVERLYSETESRLSREEQELFPLARNVVPAEQAAILGRRVEKEMARFRDEFWGH